MLILETERLALRELAPGDAGFIVELLNQPSFVRFIGDKGVRTLDDAQEYLQNGPLGSYRRHGYGLYMTQLAADATPVGICGLVKRDELEYPDLGFAFLPQYWSRGYAYESARAVLEYGRDVLGLARILAVTSLDNEGSIRLLRKVGLTFDKVIDLSGDGDEVNLFSINYGLGLAEGAAFRPAG